jgi:hypothetical protein
VEDTAADDKALSHGKFKGVVNLGGNLHESACRGPKWASRLALFGMQDMEEQRMGPAWCSGYEAKKERSLWAAAVFTTIWASAPNGSSADAANDIKVVGAGIDEANSMCMIVSHYQTQLISQHR